MTLNLTRALVITAAAALLGACSTSPQPPNWALNTQGALEQAASAYLEGRTRVADLELKLARAEIARTGLPERLARAELLRCAWQVASVDMTDCPDYAALAQDASAADQAYARYLQAQPLPADVALLPAAQRPAAQALLDGTAVESHAEDPLAQLVTAGVLLRANLASPALINQAVEAASAQGWRRPLLAWLQVQARVAEQAGDTKTAERAKRRMAVLMPSPPKP